MRPTPPTTRTSPPRLTKIKDANPDVIFLPNYYSEVPLQIQQAKRLGITSHSWVVTLGQF